MRNSFESVMRIGLEFVLDDVECFFVVVLCYEDGDGGCGGDGVVDVDVGFG